MSNINSLTRRLNKLPLGIRAKVAAVAGVQATILATKMRDRAPKRTGRLASTVRVEVGARGDRFYVKAGGPATTVPVRNGLTPSYDYANAGEFGNEHVDAQPWFYPTYRENKKAIKQSLMDTAKLAAQQEFDRS